MVNLSSFDLNLLRVLDALLREGSTVRAADRLGLSQPAVSAGLGRLRHALNDPLFVRQGQGMVPTAFAEALEHPLRQTLGRLESLLRSQTGFDPAAAELTFRISGSDYFASTLMPQLVRRVSRQAARIRLQQVDLVRDNYFEPVDQNRVDLALVPRGEFPAWADSAPLFVPDFVVIARTGHPALAGLAAGDCLPLDLFCALGHVLCSPQGRFNGLGDAALGRVGRRRHVAVSVPFFEAVLSIVTHSDLIALAPQALAKVRASAGEIAVYLPPVPLTLPEICAVWHRRRTGDPAHVWLRAEVMQSLAEAQGEGPMQAEAVMDQPR